MTRWLVPEVVQTSAMDCGPAVLKAALQGFGIPVSYGRLREACQTDVDGTSIDTLEEVARQLGLDAEQVMLPMDHLLLPQTAALPALLVTRQPNGFTHFVLVWRRHGPLVQVMDPGVGRRWVSCRRLLDEVYVHGHRVPAAAWRDWASSEAFRLPLARRLRDLGLGRDAAALIEQAAQSPGWKALARLDATTRLVAVLVQGRGLRSGREARAVLRSFLEPAQIIPDPYWSVRPALPDPEGEEQVVLRGAVLVHLTRRAGSVSDRRRAGSVSDRSHSGRSRSRLAAEGPPNCPAPELAAALAEPNIRPGRELMRLGRGAGRLSLLVLAIGLALAAGASMLEAVLLRGVLELGGLLTVSEQLLLALGCLAGFAAVLLLLELGVAGGLARLGRRLEVRLRATFLDKLPRLHDRYFQSRPVSDMAERSHALHQIRLLPPLVGRFVRATLALTLTAAVLAWIDPAGAPLAVAVAALAVAVPLVMLPLLQGLDLRVRTHAGALSRFYLDVLLGSTAVRSHGAERAVRREHESLLVEWVRASGRLLRWTVVLEGLQTLIGFGLAGWLLVQHAGRVSDAGGVLLLAYWALNLPVLGEEIAMMVRQYPLFRNVTLRLLEPLGAPEDPLLGRTIGVSPTSPLTPNPSPLGGEGRRRSDPSPLGGEGRKTTGVSVSLDGVTVRASGHTILENLDLDIAAGSHVAVVGESGAGKSSLLGLLLGWHRAASGFVHVDGEPLDAARLDQLRNETAWVDPAVQLCNASLINNLLYGTSPDAAPALGAVVEDAGLTDVLQRLPEGLQTPLGEGGGLLSGGQGQRVRLGRALVRSDARLVLLDEPFRGLDREQRRALLRRARQVWREATLLCVTHDIGETHDFERVLVVEAGRVVEDGCPAALAAAPSRYRALLDAEQALHSELWSREHWRRLRLDEGRLSEASSATTTSIGARDHARRNGEPNGTHLPKLRG